MSEIRKLMKLFIRLFFALALILFSCKTLSPSVPQFKLIPAQKSIYFQGVVDCNMAEAWIKDTFRIFSGKCGEDPVWGFPKGESDRYISEYEIEFIK